MRTRLLSITRFLLIVMALIEGCSPGRFIKPLEKKQQAVNLSLGGPLIKFGSATVPMPFLTACYGYGIDSSLTGFGTVNITSALFGNVQLDLGVTKQLLKQNRYMPAVSITPVFNIIYKNKEARKLYPQATVNAFWEYGKRRNMIYVGFDNWFELSSKRAEEVKQTNHWIFIPVIGHSFNYKKWSYNLEAKIIAPNLSNEKLVVDYETPFKNHGAFGIYFGCTRKF